MNENSSTIYFFSNFSFSLYPSLPLPPAAIKWAERGEISGSFAASCCFFSPPPSSVIDPWELNPSRYQEETSSASSRRENDPHRALGGRGRKKKEQEHQSLFTDFLLSVREGVRNKQMNKKYAPPKKSYNKVC